MRPLKFFDSPEDVLAYLIDELPASLQDDIDSMAHDEDCAEDCQELRDKIHDIECLGEMVAEMQKLLATARAINSLETLIGRKL